MALGGFRFSIDAMVLSQLERKLPIRFADIDLVGRAPGSQFLGPGKETIQLPALVYPVFLPGSGLSQIEGMRQAAETGMPLILAAGTGRVLGRFTIREVADTRTHFLGKGVAQKIEVRIDLARYMPVGGTSGVGIFRLFG